MKFTSLCFAIVHAGASEPVTQVPGTRTFGPVSGHGDLGCGSGKFLLLFRLLPRLTQCIDQSAS